MTSRSHARVRDIDRGFRRYRREASTVAEPRLVVGVTEATGGERHADNGSTAAEVAVYAEFGTRHQPASPFMRGAIDSGAATPHARAAAGAVAADGPSRSSAASALAAAGAEMADGIRARVSRLGLVDEGVLLNAITHEVRT
jgi:hypothetical protein